MKASLETSTSERVLKDVHKKVFSALNQFCKFTKIYISQLEKAVDISQKVCDSKTNLELKVEHWNEKVFAMIERFQAMSAETIEKFNNFRNDEVNTDELISYLENITKEGVATFEAWE